MKIFAPRNVEFEKSARSFGFVVFFHLTSCYFDADCRFQTSILLILALCLPPTSSHIWGQFFFTLRVIYLTCFNAINFVFLLLPFRAFCVGDLSQIDDVRPLSSVSSVSRSSSSMMHHHPSSSPIMIIIRRYLEKVCIFIVLVCCGHCSFV